jgi:hypothetical protein
MKEEVEALRQVRDELRVQAELGRAELRDRWEGLEKRFHELEGKVRSAGDAAQGDAENVKEAARLLAEEIREGYRHMRSRLKG